MCLPERFSQVAKGDGYTTCQGVACASIVKENRLSVTGQESAVGPHTGKLNCVKKPTPDKYADECHLLSFRLVYLLPLPWAFRHKDRSRPLTARPLV